MVVRLSHVIAGKHCFVEHRQKLPTSLLALSCFSCYCNLNTKRTAQMLLIDEIPDAPRPVNHLSLKRTCYECGENVKMR